MTCGHCRRGLRQNQTADESTVEDTRDAPSIAPERSRRWTTGSDEGLRAAADQLGAWSGRAFGTSRRTPPLPCFALRPVATRTTAR